MNLVSIRGATTVLENTELCILDATRDLIKSIEIANNLERSQVVSILFSCTADLNQVYPARAARELGYSDAGLMCFTEMFVEGSLERCIRVMILCNSKQEQKDVKHIYLREAKVLRPDLSNKA